MSEAVFSAQSSPDGTMIAVDQVGSLFRFWIGDGRVGRIDHPGAHLFSVEGRLGHYTMQLTATPLEPKAIESLAPIDLLGGYFRWESEYQQTTGGYSADQGTVGVVDHSYGRPILTWTYDRVAPVQPLVPPAVPISETGQVEEKRAAPFLATAAIQHDDLVLGFAVTGLGSDWSKSKLQQLAVRMAVSYERPAIL